MTTTTTPATDLITAGSPFTGLDLCQAIGLRVPHGQRGPVFDQDVWDFNPVTNLAAYLAECHKRWNLAAIRNPLWRIVAKEYLVALMVPTHAAVRELPGAFRVPRTGNGCTNKQYELIRWFNWLTDHGITTLGQVDDHVCESYLAYRRTGGDPDGAVVERRSAVNLAAQVITGLAQYRDLFSGDRYQAGFRPFGGRAAVAVAGLKTPGENSTPPVPGEILQPMLAAALYLVDTLGPHVTAMTRHIKAERARISRLPEPRSPGMDRLLQAIQRRVAEGRPFNRMPARVAQITKYTVDSDPLWEISLRDVAVEAGIGHFRTEWLPALRPALERAVTAVGVEETYGRNAALVARADRRPRRDALDAAGVRTARPQPRRRGADRVSAGDRRGHRHARQRTLRTPRGMPAATRTEGTRPGPLPAGRQGHQAPRPRRPTRRVGGHRRGPPRRRARRAVAGRGRAAGHPAVRPHGVQEHLRHLPQVGQRPGRATARPRPDPRREGRVAHAAPHPGHRAGLPARRAPCCEGGPETHQCRDHRGPLGRPGGAQAKFLAEVGEEEQQRNLGLLLDEISNYQQGIRPAGPHAKDLIAFFDTIDGTLTDEQRAAPKIILNDQELRRMLAKRAHTLHLGVANYCWFTDPAKALCLRLAGTPTADRPLIGMCDSARCPQATHHTCHRPLWEQAVQTTTVFLGNLGRGQQAERTRLQAQLDRAQRVLADIDAASTPAATGPEGARSWVG